MEELPGPAYELLIFRCFFLCAGKFHTSIDPHSKRGGRRVLVARLEEPPATPEI